MLSGAPMMSMSRGVGGPPPMGAPMMEAAMMSPPSMSVAPPMKDAFDSVDMLCEPKDAM